MGFSKICYALAFLVPRVATAILSNEDELTFVLNHLPIAEIAQDGEPSLWNDKRVSRTAGEGRFPLYGTAEYSRQCSWIGGETSPKNNNPPFDAGTASSAVESSRTTLLPNCQFLVRPFPHSREGISDWVSEIASGYIYSFQSGCQLLLDYGSDVDVAKALSTVDDMQKNNWTVPHDFGDCDRSRGCFRVSGSWNRNQVHRIEEDLQKFALKTKAGQAQDFLNPLVEASGYRYAYTGATIGKAKMIKDLEKTIPGFRYETGMACSFNAAIRLSPSASNFVPNLYTELIPTLRDADAFVVALYIRTGLTDAMAKQEEEEGGGWQVPNIEAKRSRGFNRNVITCAQQLEKDYISRGSYSRIVWMVVTDSPSVGSALASEYQGSEVPPQTKSSPRGPPTPLRRKVLTTATRGKQTRRQSNPDTDDFAEAMIDWYLLGESDVVVAMGGVSFGCTGALRTARPLYDASMGGCSQQHVLREAPARPTV